MVSGKLSFCDVTKGFSYRCFSVATDIMPLQDNKKCSFLSPRCVLDPALPGLKAAPLFYFLAPALLCFRTHIYLFCFYGKN